MSKLLTDEQRAALLGMAVKAPGGDPQTNSALPGVGTRARVICLSDRPRMPRGWLNSADGQNWLSQRAKAFSMMNTGGKMNFGFLAKNRDK